MKSFYSFCILFGAIFFWIACPVDPVTPGCQNASKDCQVGQVCCKEAGKDVGSCVATAECKQVACTTICKADSDCKNNQKCESACCIEKTDPNKECTSIKDCERQFECRRTVDKKVCTQCRQTCTTDSDCGKINGASQVCENECCRLPRCEADNDCKDRAVTPYCDKDTGDCIACVNNSHCPSKYTCSNQKCSEVECTQDSHCSTKEKPNCNTTTFLCVEPVVCKKDSDCTQDTTLNRCDPKANNGRGACKLGACQTCTTDADCGGENDLCVKTEQGLKDGSRCLNVCESNADCSSGFTCSGAIVTGKKICFPLINYCIDPCANVKCNPKERCMDGKCALIPAVCNPCVDNTLCPKGGKCQKYNTGEFCTVSCTQKEDCPTITGRKLDCVSGQCIDDNQCK